MQLEVSPAASRWLVGACLGLSATVVHAATPLSVMMIGDSITAGTIPGGYRGPTAAGLAAIGFAPTLVGTQIDTSLPAAYQHHEGHAGWRVDQLASDLLGYGYDDPGTKTAAGGYWLNGGHGTGRPAVSPNVVTILGGINDIDGFYDGNSGTANPVTSSSNPMSTPANTANILSTLEGRMTALVGTLTTTLPNATVMVCSTIPYANSFLDSTVTGATDAQRAVWAAQDRVNAAQEYGVNHYVLLFDKWLSNAFVPQEQAAHLRVNFVNLYPDFILPDGTVRGWSTFSDATGPSGYGDYGLHPNQFGYNLMAATLAPAIQSAVVPEPATLGSISLIGAAFFKRRRPASV